MISTPPENIRRIFIFELGLSVLNGTRNSYFHILRRHQPNRYNDFVLSSFPPWDKWGKALSFRVFCPGTAPGQPWDKLMALRMEQAHLASRRLRKQPVTPADSKLPRQSKHNLTCKPPQLNWGFLCLFGSNHQRNPGDTTPGFLCV